MNVFQGKRRVSCLQVCHRIRHVLWRTPFSLLDLTLSLGLMVTGIHMLVFKGLFTTYPKVLGPMAQYASQSLWGWLMTGLGVFGCLVIMVPFRPPFYVRLLARMGTAFGMLSFALNHLSTYPPPVSSAIYVTLSITAVWAVLRTRCDG